MGIGIFIFILVFAALMLPGLNLVHARHLKSYSDEIEDYLKNEKLTLKLKRKPLSSDWTNGPFDKPPLISFGIGTITVGGMVMPMNDTKHFIIETKEDKTIWLKIETSFLSSPKLTFKESPTPKKPRSKSEIGNQETFKCPACNYEIVESDKTCPDCGLLLK